MYVFKNKLKPHSSRYGSESFNNIMTGNDEFKYVNYSKGQVFEF